MTLLCGKYSTQLQAATAGELPTSTLAWGRDVLPAHFVHPPSLMHEWLGEQLDSLHVNRGSKINLIGPRGSAKSTIATLCYVLRAAVENWDRYIWIVSDTKEQAQTHLENVKTELAENKALAEVLSKCHNTGPALAGELDRTGQRRYD